MVYYKYCLSKMICDYYLQVLGFMSAGSKCEQTVNLKYPVCFLILMNADSYRGLENLLHQFLDAVFSVQYSFY